MPTIANRVKIKVDKGAFDIWEKAIALEAAGKDILHLEIGEPDFPTPPHIVAAAHQAMLAGRTKYDLPAGTPGLRQAIARYLARTRNLTVEPQQVLVTAGVKSALFCAMMAVVSPGDEYLIPDPYYPMYQSFQSYVDGKAVPYPLRPENGFQPDPADIKAKITAHTKAILINSPANPTGTIFNWESLEGIARLAIEHDLWVLADEIYAQIHFTDEFPPSIAALPGMAERTILMDGCSKPYSMTGWRVGFGLFPETLVGPVASLIVHTYSCLPPFVQDAAEAAFCGPQACVTEMRDAYRSRRDFVLEALAAIPQIKVVKPDGAFYVMIDVSAITGPNEKLLADQLLDNGLAVLPGSGLGQMGQGFLRLALNQPVAVLAEAMRRLIKTVDLNEPGFPGY